MKRGKKPMWAGRFESSQDPLVQAFTQSLSFDIRLYSHDIQGNMAYALMLGRVGIIKGKEAQRLIRALKEIEGEIRDGQLPLDPSLEDVHTLIEARLMEKVGADLGGRLHTGRSRNDQVALDMRLYLRDELRTLLKLLSQLQASFLRLAKRSIKIIIPGFTHLQHAQPVLLAHHLLAYYEMLKRDKQRFSEALGRIEVLPLGSAALAGTSYPIDREFLMEELGFKALSQNSIDAVSDRDFVVEAAFACSLCMAHLSRLCEEVILWASAEFDFMELSDAFATGSSIMPQKKNPDVAELVRGKTGRVFGSLISLLCMLKAQPLSYNRDMQEDKPAIFDALDTLKASLEVLSGLVDNLKPKKESIEKALQKGFLNATDCADYLVRKGMSFREAHKVVGGLILTCLKKGKGLEDLSLQDFKKASSLFEKDIQKHLSLEEVVRARSTLGGTSPQQVQKALKEAERELREEKNQ